MESTAESSATNNAPVGELVPLPVKDLGTLVKLSLSQIRVNPDNPRRDFDINELTKLADNIKVHGILHPIQVRYYGDPFDDKYIIIAGERRFQAARMIGMEQVPAIVTDVASDTEAEILALVENLVRTDLNPIEEGRAYDHILSHSTLSQEQLAVQIGVKQSDISKRIRLIRLPEPVQVAIASGKLSASHGTILCGISQEHPTVAEGLAIEAMEGAWTVSTLVERVKSYQDEVERQAQAQADAEQPRLLDTEEPKPAPTTAVPAAPVASSPAPAAKPSSASISAPAPSTGPEGYTGDEYVPETTTEETQEATPTLAPVAEPQITDLPKETPPPVVAAASDIEAETITVPTTGARMATSIFASDDDWMFEQGINTIDEAFVHLRNQWEYRLSPLGRKILKSLTGIYNDANPDTTVTPALRLEALLIQKAQDAGYNITTLMEIPE